MEKRYGVEVRQDGLYKIGNHKWELMFGFGKDNEEDRAGWNYRQRFSSKPNAEEIKSIIISQIDEMTNEEIRTGMVWCGHPVLLDTENQTNILGVCVGLQNGIADLFPMTYKLGDNADGSPAFHEFAGANEFADFASAVTAHKQACYAKGWQEKASIDWSTFAEHKEYE